MASCSSEGAWCQWPCSPHLSIFGWSHLASEATPGRLIHCPRHLLLGSLPEHLHGSLSLLSHLPGGHTRGPALLGFWIPFGFLQLPELTERHFLYKELSVHPTCPSIVQAEGHYTATGSSFLAPLSLSLYTGWSPNPLQERLTLVTLEAIVFL